MDNVKVDVRHSTQYRTQHWYVMNAGTREIVYENEDQQKVLDIAANFAQEYKNKIYIVMSSHSDYQWRYKNTLPEWQDDDFVSVMAHSAKAEDQLVQTGCDTAKKKSHYVFFSEEESDDLVRFSTAQIAINSAEQCLKDNKTGAYRVYKEIADVVSEQKIHVNKFDG